MKTTSLAAANMESPCREYVDSSLESSYTLHPTPDTPTPYILKYDLIGGG